MKISSKILPALVMLAFTTYLASTIPAGASGVAHRTQDQKDRFLTMVCADFNMLTRQGQGHCLQEMYGQSLEFAKSFFAAMDIHASNKEQRIQQWRAKAGLDKPAHLTEAQKTKAQTEVVYLTGYGSTCQQLSDTIMNPEQLLGLSGKTVDTLVGLPEYCVEQAVSVARAFGLHIDFNEAKHLSEHIRKVRAYYESHPNIPETRPGEKVKLPNPV
ncbi:MAG: hypothetical protein P8173_15055 [Gammaproteobacteria bacterium]|jgi:hypothetical protein